DKLVTGVQTCALPIYAAADDEQVGPGAVDLADVPGLHAAVDLDVHLPGERRAERRDPVVGLGHELLARVAGMDAHAEGQIDAFRSEERRVGKECRSGR